MTRVTKTYLDLTKILMVKIMQVEDRKGQWLVTIMCNEVENSGNPL